MMATPGSMETRQDTGPAPDTNRFVAHRIRERRTLLGFTRKHVADAVGVTTTQVQMYEAGGNRISAGRLHLIAAVLEVDVAYFFTGLAQRSLEPLVVQLADEVPVPSTREHQLDELLQNFTRLEQRHQVVLLDLARFWAGATPASPDP